MKNYIKKLYLKMIFFFYLFHLKFKIAFSLQKYIKNIHTKFTVSFYLLKLTVTLILILFKKIPSKINFKLVFI